MDSPKSMEALADNKVAEPDSLYANGYYDAAYYHAGYAVELLLKARICITLQIDNFYDFANRAKFINEDSIIKPYKVHNFEQLLILSGLIKVHKAERNNAAFDLDWSTLIKWKEDVRYTSGKKQQDVISFINSVKNFTVWIRRHL